MTSSNVPTVSGASQRGAIWTHTSHESMKMRSFTTIAVRRRSVFLAKRSIWDCTRNRTNRRYSFVQMNKRIKREQCLYTIALQKTLRSHIRVQHDGLRYNCDLCSFSSTGQSSLRLHIRTKHEGVQYKCDSCGMNFAHKDNLRLHRKVVHEGKKIKCDLCDFQAAKGQELKNTRKRTMKESVTNVTNASLKQK